MSTSFKRPNIDIASLDKIMLKLACDEKVLNGS
jgi:hypothetical protein